MAIEKINAIIQAPNGRYIDTFKGYVEDGVYKYKESGLFGLGGVEKTLPFDYTLLIEIDKKSKVAIFEKRGNEYKQLGINDLTQNDVNRVADYITVFKIAELQKDKMLTKPFDLKEIINFLLIIVTIVLLVLTYYNVSSARSYSTNLYAPVNKTLSITGKLCTIAFNQSAKDIEIQNRTILYLERGTVTGTTG